MLNEKIRSVREEKGMTRKDVAEGVKTSDKTVMNWESGKTEPKASELKRLADTMGISINELLGEEISKKNKLISRITTAIEHFNDEEIRSLSMVVEGIFLRHQSYSARREFSSKS
ncbi:Helix-turn-helix domain [Shewanella psychrophila]|uniref:Helix-turn-helix domain n=1 Tax=Shewanella psychrophila TaxID=225848 RepID=A0A1S6HKT3_9GAMM|nr:helix-turn-helix transcriptional regulator [Shewanella psychrophila]AQS36119.1 Helix-turn-helix domain [Shewanella psychrophila]